MVSPAIQESDFQRWRLNIEERMVQIERKLQNHIGAQQGATAINSPHPNLQAEEGLYVVTNPSGTREFDVTTVTAAEVADILASIITDLQSVGVFR